MPTPDQHLIEELYRELGGDNPNNGTTKGVAGSSKLTDSEVLERLFAEKDRGAEFRDIYHGEYLKHHPQWTNSEAVGSLLRKFAFWTNGDPTRMEQLIRGSKLESRKFDERRSGTTWLGQEIADAIDETPERYQGDDGTRLKITHNGRPINTSRSRSHSLGSTGTRERENESLKRSIQVVSFRGKEEPSPREWIVDNTMWKGHANTWYGAGGVAKSLLAMHQGITIATPNFDYWQGFAVKTVPVMYLDFELDADEQHRRALELCRGMGLDDVPSNFYYTQASDVPPYEAFAQALEQCVELGVQFTIVDSVGFALEGDSEGSRDVLAWFRECIRPFSSAGIGTNLIDHQAKVVKGERYSDKEAFGSVYKTNSVRSAFQVHGSSEDGTITATFTHKKNNLGWKEEPFSLEVVFGEKGGKKAITVMRLSQAAPTPDKEPTKKEMVLWAFEELKEGTAESIQAHTGIELKTVRNAISSLKRDGELKDSERKDTNGSKILFPRSRTTKGTGTGMTASEITFPSVPDGDEDNQGDQKPLSSYAEPGESTTFPELQRRRDAQDEVDFSDYDEGTSDLLMHGWKEEDGMWRQPGTGDKYEQRLALKILNDDPSVGEYFD